MKNFKNVLPFKIVIFLILFLITSPLLKSQSLSKIPFSTNTENLTIWNGTEYIPFFIKGINLGVAVPGTFPGELAATRNDYARWFVQIKEAGFNCIRLYTLHFPRFYDVLDSFNTANSQNPLLFIQGVWLEEQLPGYSNDLYYLTDAFRQEIEENIDAVHGNNTIFTRTGKAYGSYTSDVSKWCLAFIIGREIMPNEVLTTNQQNAQVSQFNGTHFSINNASPSEVWITSMLDHTVDYEAANYHTQRPVSISSWPTLDPISHPEEKDQNEDKASLDLSKIQIVNAPAGFFISYHAYPYYPDFVSDQSSYQSFSDDYGPNSYLGYLKELKSHYTQFPLIIAEYGVPSSWAIAHYATSGMNHGGFDEYNQGLTDLRLLETIRTAGAGGGIQFEWIDEWFKRTWITDPIDFIQESRILWNDVAAAEQNFGLVSFEDTIQKDTLIGLEPDSEITYLNTEVNYSFFELEIGLKNPLKIPDEMWVTFDTYSDSLGELLLPAGDTIPTRSEFALDITNFAAKLMVTEAYDIFDILFQSSGLEQLYHSIPSNGAPWKIVRVRNNSMYSDVQYIGNLQVNYDFQPPSSKDAVTIADDKIKIRIPWFYLNMVAPDQMKVFDDDRSTDEKEITVSDGVMVSVLYNKKWYTPSKRYVWNPWVKIEKTSEMENLKKSYYVMKDNLQNFNTPAIAVRDSFNFIENTFPVIVNVQEGVLKNDFNLDGESMISLITENSTNGYIDLRNDGSFEYNPNPGFTGYDSLKYCIYDGYTLSTPNTVVINVVQSTLSHTTHLANSPEIMLYPNPTQKFINIKSLQKIEQLQVFNNNGQLLETRYSETNEYSFNVENYRPGTYIVVVKTNQNVFSERFVKV